MIIQSFRNISLFYSIMLSQYSVRSKHLFIFVYRVAVLHHMRRAAVFRFQTYDSFVMVINIRKHKKCQYRDTTFKIF